MLPQTVGRIEAEMYGRTELGLCGEIGVADAEQQNQPMDSSTWCKILQGIEFPSGQQHKWLLVDLAEHAENQGFVV